MDNNEQIGMGLPAEQNEQCFGSQSGPSDLAPGYGEIQDHKEHMELYYRFHNEKSGVLKLHFSHRTQPEFNRKRLTLTRICPKPTGTYQWLPPFLCLWNGDCEERKIRFQILEKDECYVPFLPDLEESNQTLNKLNYIDHGDQVTITIGRELPFLDLKRAKPEETFTGRVTGIKKHCRHRKGDTEQEDLKECPCKGLFISAWQRETSSGKIDWHIENKGGIGETHLVDEHLESVPPRRR